MIFVTYGTQPHDFKYLGQVVNEIDSSLEVNVQIGESENNIKRLNTNIFKYTPDFDQYIEDCDILITHGGVGSIMSGLKRQKKVIAISRLAKYGEHVDDHQLEVTSKLAAQNYIYHMDREENINQVIEKVMNSSFETYQSNTVNFVRNIETILRGDK